MPDVLGAQPATTRGANESAVGILFLDDETNTVASVLEQFSLVHRAFVACLHENRGEVAATSE